MTERRAVVTGIGTINPLGNNIAEFFSNLEKGGSGAAPDVYKRQLVFCVVPPGIEPGTQGFSVLCSTN